MRYLSKVQKAGLTIRDISTKEVELEDLFICTNDGEGGLIHIE